MFFEKRKNGTKKEVYILGKKIFSYTRKKKIPNRAKLLNKIERLEQELEYIKKWQLDFCKDIPEDFPLVMSKNEQNLLIKYISTSNNHIEFGSGGSSFLALLYSNATIYSVESSKNWVDYLRSWKFIQKKEQENKIIFNTVNIGPTGEWGIPIDKSKEKDYPLYSSAVFKKINSNIEIDTIFIDGRFRVACALASLLHYPKATILIHDYTIRKEYHIIEEFMDIHETSDTLVVLTAKKNFNKSEIENLYEKYKYISQ